MARTAVPTKYGSTGAYSHTVELCQSSRRQKGVYKNMTLTERSCKEPLSWVAGV